MNKDIYLYLPEQTAYFQLLHNCPQVITTTQIIQNSSSQAVIQTLKYRYPVKYLCKQAQKLTVVCIPARQLAVIQENKIANILPCLIKTQKESQLKGYLSGHRSAIFIHQNILYRYKGCGNDNVGFVVENNQLRGSHFYHTAKRQLFITNLVNQLLMDHIGESSANSPIFLYQFPQNITELGLKNDIPLLSKYCCVFETQGDRRVGTHLISPLQIFFLNAFDHQKSDLTDFFKEKERMDQYGLNELLMDFQMMVEKGDRFIDNYDKRQQLTNYVNFGQVKDMIKPIHNFPQIIRSMASKFSPNYQQRIVSLLSIPLNWLQILEILLMKIGYEMGQVKRLFCQKGLNWGYFIDHGDWHCNAHLNNFIVRQPSIGRLTLPLDFDLAFTEEQYINIDLQSPLYGQNDKDNFQLLFLGQYNSMELSLSGLQIMNFRYSIENKEESQPPLWAKMARVTFRDTLIRSFREGMRLNKAKKIQIEQKWAVNLPQISKLVESCLMLSTNFQT